MLRLFVSFFLPWLYITAQVKYLILKKINYIWESRIDNTVKTGSNSEIKDVSIYKRIQPKI